LQTYFNQLSDYRFIIMIKNKRSARITAHMNKI